MIEISKTNISIFLKGYGILGGIVCSLGLVSLYIFSLFPVLEKNKSNFVLFLLLGLILHIFYAYVGYSLKKETSYVTKLFYKWGVKTYLFVLFFLFIFFSACANILLA